MTFPAPNPLNYAFSEDDWDDLHAMTDGNLDVVNAVIVEADRQGCSEVGVLRLANAYATARGSSTVHSTPTMMDLIELATMCEPENKNCLRTTPVTFIEGGSAVDAQHVHQLLAELTTSIAERDGESDLDIDLIDEYVRAFLSIHPFLDGNGRTAWILRTWLLGNWTTPEPLPRYRFC